MAESVRLVALTATARVMLAGGFASLARRCGCANRRAPLVRRSGFSRAHLAPACHAARCISWAYVFVDLFWCCHTAFAPRSQAVFHSATFASARDEFLVRRHRVHHFAESC